MVAAEVTTWAGLALVAYAYIGYPILLIVATRLRSNRSGSTYPSAATPAVSLLVAACNEERFIERRVANALTMDYPADLIEVVVASDGSTDRTNEIVRSFNDPRVQLLEYPVRRGKAAVLNDSVPQLRGEIVLFSDANTFFEPDAAEKLSRWFVDPSILAVCGKLILTDPATGTNVDSLYWKYETFLKRCEGRLGALLGANGAIYALRRADYAPIPSDTIIDDFYIPLAARLRKGGQIIYDETAVAHEECPAEIADEFRRRARIGAGGFQALVRLWPLLLPTQGWIALTFFSHKFLRWLCPFFLILVLVANAMLLDQPLYRALFAAQIAFYVLALLGNWLPGRNPAVRLVRLTTMFTSMNLALLAGFWRWISGRQGGIWQRTAR